jgi:hypothetical protein
MQSRGTGWIAWCPGGRSLRHKFRETVVHASPSCYEYSMTEREALEPTLREMVRGDSNTRQHKGEQGTVEWKGPVKSDGARAFLLPVNSRIILESD